MKFILILLAVLICNHAEAKSYLCITDSAVGFQFKSETVGNELEPRKLWHSKWLVKSYPNKVKGDGYLWEVTRIEDGSIQTTWVAGYSEPTGKTGEVALVFSGNFFVMSTVNLRYVMAVTGDWHLVGPNIQQGGNMLLPNGVSFLDLGHCTPL